ncbi:MAG: serine/threonine protein phosphatase [Caldilineales bacterium]|nr:serine/threonine protein phosphatase [Caldilineales bacterium]MDW8317647.1 metallophosphoesterase family protein [Anaerolineae bacterium]
MAGIFVVGDVHGYLQPLVRCLQRAGLVDEAGGWQAGQAVLWFLGDYVDRGPDSMGVVDYVMALQQQAAARGGRVNALLGNHDVAMLAAHRFGDRLAPGLQRSFIAEWLALGGREEELARLERRHVAWLAQLPALAAVNDTLLAHADSPFYLEYGDTLEAINAAVAGVLESDDVEAWSGLLAGFNEHRAFVDGKKNGHVKLRAMLDRLGAQRLVHGHTPIFTLTGQAPSAVLGPLVYAEGRCVNLDGCFYAGGPGFVWRLDRQGAA